MHGLSGFASALVIAPERLPACPRSLGTTMHCLGTEVYSTCGDEPHIPANQLAQAINPTISAPAAAATAAKPQNLTALAFWRRSTRSLLKFTASFSRLLKIDAILLAATGAQWDNFISPAEAADVQAPLDSGLSFAQPIKMQLRLVSSDGTVTQCTVSITSILGNSNEEELLWLIVPDFSVSLPSVLTPSITPALARRPSGSFSGSEEEEADSVEAEPVPVVRELVPAKTKSRKPWDASIIKYSLKRRSPKKTPSPEPRKRSDSCNPHVVMDRLVKIVIGRLPT